MNKIKIRNCIGVCSVNEGTKMIAYHAAKLKPQSVLDVGTGTGFIPIYLASLGIKATGTDINSLAIELAQKNMMENGLLVDFFISDLFNKVKEKYELICFNPPLGNIASPKLTKLLEIIKSLIPKNNHFFAWLAFNLFKKQNEKLIKRFLDERKNYLTLNGKTLIFFDKAYLYLLTENYEIVEKSKDNNGYLCLIK